MQITFRPATSTDVPFLLDSWMKSWRVSPYAGTIRNDLYFHTQRQTIEGLIARGAEFLLAVSTTRQDRILGWVCYEAADFALVHYLYVKDAYIRLGIAQQLLDRVPGARPGVYTHRYHQVTEVCEGWRWVPEICRRKLGPSRAAEPGSVHAADTDSGA